jgi:hypothetical protein
MKQKKLKKLIYSKYLSKIYSFLNLNTRRTSAGFTESNRFHSLVLIICLSQLFIRFMHVVVRLSLLSISLK